MKYETKFDLYCKLIAQRIKNVNKSKMPTFAGVKAFFS